MIANFLSVRNDFCFLLRCTRSDYSVRNDFTGLDIAALTAWKLTVNKVIISAANPASTNTGHDILIL